MGEVERCGVGRISFVCVNGGRAPSASFRGELLGVNESRHMGECATHWVIVAGPPMHRLPTILDTPRGSRQSRRTLRVRWSDARPQNSPQPEQTACVQWTTSLQVTASHCSSPDSENPATLGHHRHHAVGFSAECLILFFMIL